MIQVRPFAGLGQFRNEWLNARHHFSFGQYHDPQRMGFGRLRVWNDDEIAAGAGFDPHPHREMEIVTYIREPPSPTGTIWGTRAERSPATSR
jgi:redox-sensitive bicupin YhaK (pirin superfamily)